MFSTKRKTKSLLKTATILLVFSLFLTLQYPVIGFDEDELDQYQKLWNGGIGVGYPDMLAQSFVPTDNLLTRVEINMYKAQQTKHNISVAIRNNLSGPNLVEFSLSSDAIPSSGGWVEFDFTDLQVIINETYYIVLIPEGTSMSYVWRGFDSSNFDNYPQGEAWLFTGGEWSDDDFLIQDWTFKTYKSHFSLPPTIPHQPVGPTEEYSWIDLEFQTNTTDPNGDDVSYGWDWNGDNVVDEWTNYFSSGTNVSTSHLFTRSGLFSVQVKAKDIYDVESGFSDPLLVNITNDPPIPPQSPDGKRVVLVGENVWYTTWTTDVENHFVKYGWDWNGDEVVDEWTAFHPSGYEINYSYRWDQSGTYGVKVKAMDEYGAQSNFSNVTRVVVVNIENDPPDKPLRPIGEAKGWKGLSYSYGSSTVDPNADLIWYLWDWDDGTTSEWIGPFESGQSCNVSHTWDTRGEFQVKVKARDESGVESVWSDSLPVSMPLGLPRFFIDAFWYVKQMFFTD
ncbi:MAG: PKD domain-containing protein [Candidatus Thermoplasmatota archaeon]|nr:PKD domain-containing protein [Candidatus Thermoplasmatota archaeon]MBS3801927.1 PKD domain-containing protein [Candidatus Thermoplasmatota archaeon]